VTVLVETSRPAGSPARRLSTHQVTAFDYAARLRGLAETIPGRVSLVSGGHNSYASGASAASHLVESGPLPTAVVGLSDVMALGALSVFTERGVAVPGDVSVCGFDDIVAAREANLTTVQQSIRRRGQLIGRMLIDPETQPRQVMLPIRLVVRSSSGRRRG
jgi:DNA-binding LacI/PurR family transcriptional regulator